MYKDMYYHISHKIFIVLIVVYKFIITSTTDYSVAESNCITLYFFPSWTKNVMLIRNGMIKLCNIL